MVKLSLVNKAGKNRKFLNIFSIDRKGSLNLSIEAIVIVVIAFVVLGLGLGFVKGQFEQITDTSSQVQEQISQQILDDLRRSNNKLSFPSNDLTYETKDETVLAVGVKNTDDQSKHFKLGFQVKDGSTFVEFESGVTRDISSQSAEAEIIWDDSWQEMGAGDTKVISFSLTAPDKQGTYLYKVYLMESDDGSDNTESEYDSTTFFIKTS
jgi:hypothetical protein